MIAIPNCINNQVVQGRRIPRDSMQRAKNGKGLKRLTAVCIRSGTAYPRENVSRKRMLTPNRMSVVNNPKGTLDYEYATKYCEAAASHANMHAATHRRPSLPLLFASARPLRHPSSFALRRRFALGARKIQERKRARRKWRRGTHRVAKLCYSSSLRFLYHSRLASTSLPKSSRVLQK